MDILCLNLIYEHILIFKWFLNTSRRDSMGQEMYLYVRQKIMFRTPRVTRIFMEGNKLIQANWNFLIFFFRSPPNDWFPHAYGLCFKIISTCGLLQIHHKYTCTYTDVFTKAYFVCVHKQYIRHGRTISICLLVHLLHLCCMYTYNSIYFTTDR